MAAASSSRIRKKEPPDGGASPRALAYVADAPSRALVVEALERRGYEATAAATLAEAEAAQREQPADVIVVDSRGAGAQQLCRAVRDLFDGDDAVILALVAHGAPTELLDAGADDFVSGMLDASLLDARLRIIDRLLQQRRDRRAGELPISPPEPGLVGQAYRRSVLLSSLIVDRELRVLDYNHEGEQSPLGNDGPPITIGQPFQRYTDASHWPAIEQVLRRALDGTAGHDSRRIQLDDGGRWLELSTEPLRNDRGEIVGAVLSAFQLGGRAEVDAAVAATEHRFRSLVHQSSDILLLLDEQLVIRFANSSVERVLGWRREELESRKITEFVHPDDLPRVFAALSRAMARPDMPIEAVVRARCKDGRWVTLEALGTSHIADPAIRGIIMNIRDISDRKRNEKALRESRRILQSTLNALSSHIAILDDAGTILAVNRSWSRRAADRGALRPIGVGESYLAACEGPAADVSDSAALGAGIRDVISGTRERFEREYSVGEPGAMRWFLARVTRFADAAAVVVAHEEITQHKQAGEALRRSEASFRALIEGSPEIILVHRDNKILYANPAALTALGHGDASTILGSPTSDVLQPESQEAEDDAAIARAAGKREAPVERRLIRRDGKTVIADALALPLPFDGQPASVVIARDISERKNMEGQLMLADRMVSIGRMAAGVAHEINNPLAYVTGNLRFLSEEIGRLSVSFPEVRLRDVDDAVRDCIDGVERVRVIVRDLKTFSRSDEETRGPVELRRVLESSANMAWNEIRHRARLVKDYGDVAPVEGNEARIGQVFLNLLVNAAQAIPEGAADQNEIRLITRPGPSGNVIIEVKDTGSGIPAEIRSRLFDPFFTTKPVGVGTGLGLSICHGIVMSLGGEIEIESEVGKGSTFRVTLPAARALPKVQQTSATQPSIGKRGHILIVDDEPMIGKSVRRLLAQEHDVVCCLSAKEALAKIASETFDLMLCDLMMPEMTGMELHAELVKLGSPMAEKTVFLTGGAFTASATEFLDTVTNVRVEKPFDGKALRAIVRAKLRQS